MQIGDKVLDLFGETCTIISIDTDSNTAVVRFELDDFEEEWDLDDLTLIKY